MRFGKPWLAGAVTILVYLISLIGIGPIQAIITQSTPMPAPIVIGGEAYAAETPLTVQEICQPYNNNQNRLDACKDGFGAGGQGDQRTVACDSFAGEIQKACLAGYDGYQNEGRDPPDDGSGTLGAGDSGNPPKCEGGDFGWLICAGMEWIQSVVAFVETNIIAPLLDTPSLTFDGPLYEIWQVMRGLATVIFVLVFIFLIVANTLSLDIKTYHIRRMLPRLVIAAIMVQASYILAAVSVDVANVLGRGIYDLISGVIPEYSGTITGPEAATTYGIGLVGVIAAAMAVAGAVASGTIFLVMLGAVVGVIVTFLTLVLRQVILALLIITMPLAIVLWVLPNTEEFFEEWAELFVKLLLMYPLIMLFFAAGKIFSVAASAAAGTATVAPIFAMVGLVAPLFMIPATFNLSGTLFKGSRNLMLKAAGKAHSGVSDKIKDSDAMKNYQGKRTSAGVLALANTNKRLDAWQNDPNAGRGKRFLAGHRKALLFAQASAVGNPKFAGQLGREKSMQDEIKRSGKELEDMGVGRPDYEKLAGASSRSELPSMLRAHYTVAGQAAALRKLHKDKALDEGGHVLDSLSRMQDQRRAAEIRRLGMQGDGGTVWVTDPANANGGMDGKGLLKPDVGAKIKSGNLANMMTSTETLNRNFGMNTSNTPSQRTRRLGEVDVAGKLTGNLHFMERELDRHGLVGGETLTLTPETLKTSLTGRLAGDSHAAGRRHMKELLTNGAAGRRINVLERYSQALLSHGYAAEAAEVRKSVENLKGLRDNANNLIND
jgi:hypothetical protein